MLKYLHWGKGLKHCRSLHKPKQLSVSEKYSQRGTHGDKSEEAESREHWVKNQVLYCDGEKHAN
jgi:hypothetical protein